MKITDNTPFRNSGGVIDIFGRVRGSLKFGLSWYDRVKAQDMVAAALDKVLGTNFILLRNVILHNTDIDLPMVLIGPPGISLINVAHESGVYRAKGNEWSTVSGDKYVPVPENLVKVTSTMGRVLQLYLDRAGYKGELTVESILMAADPGIHIQSDHPAVSQIVLSDALERFANSKNQAAPIFSASRVTELANAITKGPRKMGAATDDSYLPANETASELEAPSAVNAEAQEEANPDFSADALGFSFSEAGENQAGETSGAEPSVPPFIDENESAEAGEPPKSSDQPAAAKSKKRGWFGMTRAQMLILAGILLFWLCAMAAFGIYVYTNLNV